MPPSTLISVGERATAVRAQMVELRQATWADQLEGRRAQGLPWPGFDLGMESARIHRISAGRTHGRLGLGMGMGAASGAVESPTRADVVACRVERIFVEHDVAAGRSAGGRGHRRSVSQGIEGGQGR